MLNEIDITTKAKVLLEALPYIQRFRGSTFVIKYGGSFMDDANPEIRGRVATDIVFLASVGINVVVVHGGAKAISRAMEKEGIEPEFKNGLRITTSETVNIVEKTLNEEINPEICQLIKGKNGNPKGIIGNDLFLCQKLIHTKNGCEIDLGFVGDIQEVQEKVIEKAISDGYIPVITPIAKDSKGQSFNTNADVAASHVASALNARRLVYLCDVPGLLKDQNDSESIISTLKFNEVDDLIDSGIISKGMEPKVRSAKRALENGVHRVHFIDGHMAHSLLLEIFTDKGIGTEIVNPY